MTAFFITGIMIEIVKGYCAKVQSIGVNNNYNTIFVAFAKDTNLSPYLNHYVEISGEISIFKNKTYLFANKIIDLGGML